MAILPEPSLWALSFAVFGLFGKFAFDTKRDKNYQGAWFWWMWAFAPALLTSFYLKTETGVPVEHRNIIVGAFGGLFGALGSIWLAYVICNIRANAQIPGGTPPMTVNPPPPINAPGNTGIVTSGQSGGTNIVNQIPPIVGFTKEAGHRLLKLVDKAIPVTVVVVGPNSDLPVGHQVAAFLTENGYKVESVDITQIANPPPENNYTLYRRGAGQDLLVAPRFIR